MKKLMLLGACVALSACSVARVAKLGPLTFDLKVDEGGKAVVTVSDEKCGQLSVLRGSVDAGVAACSAVNASKSK